MAIFFLHFSMRIEHNKNLKNHNSFGIEVFAKTFIEYENTSELAKYILEVKLRTQKFLLLGSGSNMLFIENFEGIVLHSAIKTIEIIEEGNEFVLVKVGSGVLWDEFVAWSVEHNLWGAENLSAIPGMTGAAPVQNIGAYGVEAKDIIDTVEGIFIIDGSRFILSFEECEFDYRDSVFKNELAGKTIITSVVFRMTKKVSPNLGYGQVQEEVEKLGGPELSNIRKAIISIRESKLPKPEILGNAGSFFKNPVVKSGFYEDLKIQYPDIPGYILKDNNIKIPAAWLIEKAGLKGYRDGNVGIHLKQPLVLVNYGGGTGTEIEKLARYVMQTVETRFGIILQPEVVFIK